MNKNPRPAVEILAPSVKKLGRSGTSYLRGAVFSLYSSLSAME